MILRWLPIAAGALAGALLVGGWQQYRVMKCQTRIATLERDYAKASAKAVQDALDKTAVWQQKVDDAIDELHATTTRNREAQAALDDSLRGLDAATGRVRSDLANLPARIAGASEAAVADFAATCTAVLETMADAGGDMARDGGRIAAAADQHAADAVMLQRAWPK